MYFFLFFFANISKQMIKLQKISNTSILVKHSNILLLISFTDLKIFFQLLNQQSIVTIILYNSHHKVIINITINNHSNQKDDRSYQNNHRFFFKSIYNRSIMFIFQLVARTFLHLCCCLVYVVYPPINCFLLSFHSSGKSSH